jgi:hypothetical protein
LRRIERAGRHDHLGGRVRDAFFAARRVFDADGPAAIEQDAARQRIGDDSEIAAPARRLEIADRSRASPAVLRGELEITRALLRRAVEVVIARKTRMLR